MVRATDYRCEKHSRLESWLRANTLSSRGAKTKASRNGGRWEREKFSPAEIDGSFRLQKLTRYGEKRWKERDKLTEKERERRDNENTTANCITIAVFSHKFLTLSLAERWFICRVSNKFWFFSVYYTNMLLFHLEYLPCATWICVVTIFLN